MKGVFPASKNKTTTKRARKPTKRDIVRQVYKQSGMKPPSLRNRPTDLQRILRAARQNERLADNISYDEQLQLESDLAIIGIMAGRTSGTLPERLVAKWLLNNGYSYGGFGDTYNPTSDFAFQVPLLGGRKSSGGTVVDILVSPNASNTKKGVAVYPEGYYWHTLGNQPLKDKAKYALLESKGYKVVSMWDYEVENSGFLDAKMRQIVGR